MGIAAAVLAVRQPPAFQTTAALDAVAAADPAAAARRFLTKAAALHEAARRPGAWDMVFTQDECNAWLAEDLPRHDGLVPAGWREPRVRFKPGVVEAAAVVTRADLLPEWICPDWILGAVRPVVAVELEVRLVALGRVECRVVRASAGLLPLPGGPILHLLAAALQRRGMICELPRVDGRSVLMVTLPSGGPSNPAVRVAALAVHDGEILVAGTTLEP